MFAPRTSVHLHAGFIAFNQEAAVRSQAQFVCFELFEGWAPGAARPDVDCDGTPMCLTKECNCMGTGRLQGTGSGSLYCPRQPPLKGLVHAHTSSGLRLIAHVGGIVS